jgi:GNAT superfamily N-acetyltransferase
VTSPVRTTRIFLPSDQQQIEWLYARTPRASGVSSRPARLPADLRNIDEAFARFWVVVESTSDEDVVVGMAGVQDVAMDSVEPPLAPFISTERTLRLHRVTVAPERWRFGIGRMLVAAAVEWARLNNFASLVLETTPQQEAAVALYLATGFTDIGRTQFGIWELIWFEQKVH